MKTRREMRIACLSAVAGGAILMGLTGCNEEKKDDPAAVVEKAKTEQPAEAAPAKPDPAKAKPKDHPAH